MMLPFPFQDGFLDFRDVCARILAFQLYESKKNIPMLTGVHVITV